MGGIANGEFELKLELTHEQLQRVGAHPALVDLTVGQPVTRTLRSIYFDTPDHRLRAEGISLRLRSDGEVWLQTIKSRVGLSNGVSNPLEVEVIVTIPEPDLKAIDDRKLRRRVEKTLGKSVLEPVFETVVARTTRQLHPSDSDLELALDEGFIRAGTAEGPLCEAELELKSGRPECLLELATKLFSTETVRLSGTSKADRGYDLALGKADAAVEPRRAEPVRLLPGDTCAAAFARIVQSTIDQIVTNRRAILKTDDPEATHQLRIGLRRLRSALRVFRPLDDTPALRELEGHARELARIVGELRDADVLIGNIYASVAGAVKDDPGLPPLRDALLAHRARAREQVRLALDGRQWSVLHLYLALWPRTMAGSANLSAPIGKFASSALDKCWKKTARFGKRLSELEPEQIHDMRKALKMLRYTSEFFASLHAEADTRPFLKEVKALQDVFGYVNDVATAGRLRTLGLEGCGNGAEAHRAAGYVLGWHDAEATHRWRDAHKGWRNLKQVARFWR